MAYLGSLELYQILKAIDDGDVVPTDALLCAFSQITHFNVLGGCEVPRSASLLTSVQTVVFDKAYRGNFSFLSELLHVKYISATNGAVYDPDDEGRLSALFHAIEPLSELEELYLYGRGNEIRSLDGFPILPSLKKLDISYNYVRTLAPLSGLQLDELLLTANPLQDIMFDGIGSLKKLDLGGTHIGDDASACLGNAHNLEYLNMAGTFITNLDFLKGMPHMKDLCLCELMDIRPLRCLKELERFTIFAPSELTGLEVFKELPHIHSVELYCKDRWARLFPFQLLYYGFILFRRLVFPGLWTRQHLSGLSGSNIAELFLYGNFSRIDLKSMKNMEKLECITINGVAVKSSPLA